LLLLRIKYHHQRGGFRLPANQGCRAAEWRRSTLTV